MEAELFSTYMNDLLKKIKKARFIWIAGNGGSASTAEHFANDLVKKGYKAIALSANTSIITMIANDYGYKYIFSKQLEVYANKQDLLITISCSGTSGNIIEALIIAHNKDINLFTFETLFRGGEKPTLKDYGLLEDKHLKFAHEVANAL